MGASPDEPEQHRAVGLVLVLLGGLGLAIGAACLVTGVRLPLADGPSMAATGLLVLGVGVGLRFRA